MLLPVGHRNDESLDRKYCRQRQNRSGDHVENRTVPWTRDPAAIKLALVERGTIVGADIFDRVQLSVDITEQDLDTLNDDAVGRAQFDIGDVRNGGGFSQWNGPRGCVQR
jgi:hypothetical protein